MEPEHIDNILIEITREFTQPQNFNRILNEQVLANAIFYSFVVGVLSNDEDEYDKIDDIHYVKEWIEEKEHILKGFMVKGDSEE